MKQILETVNNLQMEAVHQHRELSNMFDFLGLHGFKRLHEYRMLEELRMNKKFNAWAINHCGHILKCSAAFQAVIPDEFMDENLAPSSLKPETVRTYAMKGFDFYEEKLAHEMGVLQRVYQDLHGHGHIEAALQIAKFIKYVGKETKKCRRIIQGMRNFDNSLHGIMLVQKHYHDKYK